ncbi:hypothetical protein C8F01DRAFT_1156287 [Mycena amicta]|nr:hypothetical protein C8F01DRAFT_1156287 [Mycena amicta]
MDEVFTALRRLSPGLISPGSQKARKKARKDAPFLSRTAGVKKTARRRPTAGARSRAPRTVGDIHPALGFDASGSFMMDQDVYDAGLNFEASVTWDVSRQTEDGYGTFLENAALLADDIDTVATAFARALDGESTTATVGRDSHAAGGSGHRAHATMPAGTFIVTTAPQAQAQVATTYQAVALDGFCAGHGACPNCRNADPGVGQWRFGEVSQTMVCSACGLYERRTGTRRPPELEARKMLRLSSGGRR